MRFWHSTWFKKASWKNVLYKNIWLDWVIKFDKLKEIQKIKQELQVLNKNRLSEKHIFLYYLNQQLLELTNLNDHEQQNKLPILNQSINDLKNEINLKLQGGYESGHNRWRLKRYGA